MSFALKLPVLHATVDVGVVSGDTECQICVGGPLVRAGKGLRIYTSFPPHPGSGSAGIARSDIDLLCERGLGGFPCQGVLAPTASDDEYFHILDPIEGAPTAPIRLV